MNGASLASLFKFLVEAVNENKFPELPSLWNSWLQQLTDSARTDAFKTYKKSMDEVLERTDVASEEEFKNLHLEKKKEAESLYKDLLFGFEKIYKSKLPDLEVFITISLSVTNYSFILHRTRSKKDMN
jgi:hypothetical protein